MRVQRVEAQALVSTKYQVARTKYHVPSILFLTEGEIFVRDHVSGHDFSRAVTKQKNRAFRPWGTALSG